MMWLSCCVAAEGNRLLRKSLNICDANILCNVLSTTYFGRRRGGMNEGCGEGKHLPLITLCAIVFAYFHCGVSLCVTVKQVNG